MGLRKFGVQRWDFIVLLERTASSTACALHLSDIMAIDIFNPIALAAGLVVLLLALYSLRSGPGILWNAADRLGKPRFRKVLTPDAYQSFELVQKTIVSHNTALYFHCLPS